MMSETEVAAGVAVIATAETTRTTTSRRPWNPMLARVAEETTEKIEIIGRRRTTRQNLSKSTSAKSPPYTLRRSFRTRSSRCSKSITMLMSARKNLSKIRSRRRRPKNNRRRLRNQTSRVS